MTSTFHKLGKVSTWRKVALHTWSRPSDPTVYGTMEIDVSRTVPYLERLRQRSGVKVTITHLVGKAVAMAFRERPDLNGIIRRGRIYLRDTVDVFFQVAFDGGEDLSGVKVDRADEKSVVEIAQELARKAERVRQKTDENLRSTTRMLNALPASLVGAALRFVSSLSYDYDLDLRRFGVPWDQFGSVMVTNVGGFGVTHGYAPLVPFARTPALLTVGAIIDRPIAREGQVVVAPVLTVGATFDHRFIDGFQAAKLSRRFQDIVGDPERFLG
jgi:pyruvate/2-oxoglutarate dehydrogenase complex dihydrolipoamide acyltransferase (E2) component